MLFRSEGTKYAKTTALYVGDDGYSWWWLRSPGRDASDAATVLSGGGVNAPGDIVYYNVYGIRPALWIDTSKLK